ncbi:MAG: hypothetical protein K2M05_07250 [Paramuribaculum sp.]|nr:hypothetical protein [Paramuribaculum sp.]
MTGIVATSCDEGMIYEHNELPATSGLTVVVEVPTSGLESWQTISSPSCHPALAGFTREGSYAEVSTNIGVLDNSSRFILTGVDESVAEIRFSVLDRLRKQIHQFVSLPIEDAVTDGDTLRFKLEEPIDLSISAAVQQRIFNTTCIACLGGGNFVAANLNLTPTHSLNSLIGKRATKCGEMSDTLRVAGGHPEKSLLYLILTSRISENWAYDHSVEVVDPTVTDMMRDWILSISEE